MLSGNKSSLLSSGVGGSVSIGFRTGLGEEEIEEIAILKKQLEKSEKRVNKIIKGTFLLNMYIAYFGFGYVDLFIQTPKIIME